MREQTPLIALLLTYILAGKIGLLFSYAHPAVTLVWPSSGVALGAFLILGYRIWPALLVAALALYGTVAGPTPAAVALALASTTEALLAAVLVNRYAGGRNALQTPRNCLRFAGVLIVSSIVMAGTVKTLMLVLTGSAAGVGGYDRIWITHAVGSLVGSLTITPLVLQYSRRSRERWRRPEALAIGGALLAVSIVGMMVFFRVPLEIRGLPHELLCLPVLLWIASRFGRAAAAGGVLLLATFAIAGTMAGHGPFVRATPFASLLEVHFFLGVTAVLTLWLAALTSEHKVAEAQLRELVATDPLTGLPNYRRLLEVLTLEIARSDRGGRTFAIVFFDMDGLKRINDELGHLVGSRAVCRLAETLRSACRTTDTPARYGGDEFVAVLPDTDYDGARLVVDRTMERLAADDDHPRLSVSAGIALYPRDGVTPASLLSAADRALYAAKAKAASTRRRVVEWRQWTSAS